MLLGNAIRVTADISDGQPNLVTVEVKDPNGTTKASATMAEIETDRWEYIYQSASGDVAGPYTASITVTDGTYTSKFTQTFSLT